MRLPIQSAGTLGHLRRAPGVKALEQNHDVWLYGESCDEALARLLALVPGGQRFRVLSDGQLVPHAKTVPLGRLPAGEWTPLSQWLRLALPAATNVPPSRLEPVQLVLMPSNLVREPNMLETSLQTWASYLSLAPRWRIECWSFVASREGQILVRGLPLPPIPGRQWVAEHGIAVPAGYAWSPPVDAPALRRVLKLADGEVALLRPEGPWERVAPEQWVQASRAAARATSEVLGR
jgi:hypothetical protein